MKKMLISSAFAAAMLVSPYAFAQGTTCADALRQADMDQQSTSNTVAADVRKEIEMAREMMGKKDEAGCLKHMDNWRRMRAAR